MRIVLLCISTGFPFGQALHEGLFVQHREAQLHGFLELAARCLAGDHTGGLLRDTARHLGAQRLQTCLAFITRHAVEAAGQYPGLACQRLGALTDLDLFPAQATGEQRFQRLVVGRLLEEGMDMRGDDGADIFHCLQRGLIRCAQRFKRAEVRGQIRGGGFPDFPDAEGVDETCQGGIAALAQRGDQIGGGLLAHARQLSQGGSFQVEQIRRCLDQLTLDQLLDQLLAEAIDIQRLATGEVLEGFLALRGADQSARAACHHLAFEALDLGAAHRAAVRQHDGFTAGAFAGDPHHLRDDIASPANDDTVTDLHAETFHLVHVVQCGVGDHHTGDLHRCQSGDRRQRASASDLKIDALQGGFLFLRRVLVGDGPARRARHEAQFTLQTQCIELDDRAIDVVIEAITLLAEATGVVDDALGTAHHLKLRAGAEAIVVEQRHQTGMILAGLAGEQRIIHPRDLIGAEFQRARGGDVGIQLAQAAGGGIARVGEHLAILVAAARVQRLEASVAHVDLAAHFQQLRQIITPQLERDRADGAQVGGDTFAGAAIAARHALHQHAILVDERHGQAIELGLAAEAQLVTRILGVSQLQRFRRTLHEGAQLIVIEGVVERQHRHRMLHFFKPAGRRGSDTLGGRFRGDQLGIFGFQRLEATQARVVVGIGQRRIIQHVIAVAGLEQLAMQLRDLLHHLGRHAFHHGRFRGAGSARGVGIIGRRRKQIILG